MQTPTSIHGFPVKAPASCCQRNSCCRPARGRVSSSILPEYRLYYFPKGSGTVMTFPIGIGRTGFQTPAATTKIVAKIVNPTWYPTKAHREEHAELGDELPSAVPPGPDNPLGHLAIQLTLPGYFLHGTNKPFGVGQRVSHGCVRLYPDDIQSFADAVPIGMEVRIIDAPIKVSWQEGTLWLESHPPLEGDPDMAKMTQLVNKAIDGQNVVDRLDARRRNSPDIHWDARANLY